MTKFILTGMIAFSFSLFLSAQSVKWTDIGQQTRTNQQIVPESYRAMTVDFESLKAQLLAAPREGVSLRNSNYLIQLPTPEGGRASFKIVEESVMEPGLQNRYPDIRTFNGTGTGEYATAQINLDFTLKGFHAQVLINGKSFYIDPISPGELNTYIVYTRDSFNKSNSKTMASCKPDNIGLPDPNDTHQTGQKTNNPVEVEFPQASNGTQLRTYQLALACTGEYAQFHGGTKPLVLSAMTTTMNRVNGIYKRDICLRMLLVSNNDDLIFLNSVTDGYTNNSGGALLSENQAKIDLIIGSSNYDIGHVFSTGGGGIASLGVVCNNSSKARGVTGQGNPIGDPFDIDYVAHEMGHQWGAAHTFNNSCSGNRMSAAAFEPGSGSTIMAYAGICSPNLQSNSDAHFHNHSYNEIRTYSVDGNGNSCAVITTANNNPPSLSISAGGFTIPKSTPFELTMSATDPNSDPMTYCWEQYDLGPTTSGSDNNLTNPSGNAPIFRSWPPTSNPTRTFPRLSDLINNTTVIGERLPTYARDLTFRCTVRDNYTNGAVNDAEIDFDVAANSGPFLVTSPNTATTWTVGSNQTITWNVANTTASPVSCGSVNIYLSTDGGLTYPTLLIGNTANDGLQTIVVPDISTSQARIKVRSIGNIFFDISNQNFSISAAEPPANDEICNAIRINCGDDLAGSNMFATESALGNPSCATGTDYDVFYKFFATTGSTYTITINGANYDAVLAIYSGSCFGELTEIDCADDGTSSGVEETITYTATEDQEIYIQTHDWFASGGEFNITLECVFGNNDPCDASLLTCGESENGSTIGATQSSLVTPTCAGGTPADVFYKIEAIADVNYTVSVNGDNFDGVMVAYTGNCSNDLDEISCSDVFGDGNAETVNFTLLNNQTVYIRVYDWLSNGGSFVIDVSCANVPYDEPCEARNLSCSESYSGSSSGATPSSVDNSSCESINSHQDVFFKFTALANTDYMVTVNGDNYDGVLVAYTGSCSGTLTEIDCSDNGFFAGIAETVNILVPTEQEIIIKTYDYYSTGPSDFTISLICPIPDNDECADAVALSVNNAGACPANQVEGTTVGATASNPEACESESQDVFYVFNSGDNSEVIINLNTISATDLVLSVFEADCNATAFFCSINTNQSPQITVSPFTIYYVRVHSFDPTSTGTFNICIEEFAPSLSIMNGTVTGWNNSCAERDVQISLIDYSNSDNNLGLTTTLNSDGSFSTAGNDIAASSYTILMKVDGGLAVLLNNVVLSEGANNVVFPSVKLGDLNNDNTINIVDFSALTSEFGTTSGDAGFNILADLNCDGVINVVDFSLIVPSFGLVGEGFVL